MSSVRRREHTDAFVEVLHSAGHTVGDGKKPDEGGYQPDGSFVPYMTVYPLPGGGRSGTLENPHEDAQLIYQVTCIGISRQQAEWMADAADVILDGVEVAGRRIHSMPEMNPGVTRDDTITPPLFVATPRYRLRTTPN